MGKLVTSKVILLDSVLNFGLLVACMMRIKDIDLVNLDAITEWVFVIAFLVLGLFTVSDIIYWIMRMRKKNGRIVSEIARYSVYVKVFAIIAVGIVVGVNEYFSAIYR